MISLDALTSWSSSLLIVIICVGSCLYTQFVSSQCLDDQKSLLLDFKKNFKITWSDSTTGNFVGWDQTSDCCHWTGIECDNSTGRVIGLDLNSKYIEGRIDNSTSLFRLQFLRTLDLANNIFSGSIPSSLVSLNLLEHVDLNNNQWFSGPIPSFSSAKNLKYLDLSNNRLNGSITSTDWGKLYNLEFLCLGNNLLDGNIPKSLFTHPSLQTLILGMNKLNGQLNEFTSSKLELLDLSYNNLEGPVPNSIYQLNELTNLYLSSNKFNGTLKLAELLNRKKLFYHLELSHNLLSVDINGCGVNSSFPQLYSLALANCSLRAIPDFLKNQSLNNLDLSMNQISGTIPGWIWGIPNMSLNLSCNHFVQAEPPLSLPNNSLNLVPYSLDLHSNNLQGHFPFVSSQLRYLDCSDNNFTSIDSDIGNYLTPDIPPFVSFSRNNLHGSIPVTLCNATQLQILNLEYNHFHGTIPDCLFAMTQLIVLNLGGNSLGGAIPDTFPENNMTYMSLQTLNLNDNFLQGRIPPSLTKNNPLKVLDLGNNELSDTFPCDMGSSFQLQVLVLRSNKLHGTMVCPEYDEAFWPEWSELQIMDLASNHFTGKLPAQIFLRLTAKMAGTDVIQTTEFDGSHGITSADGSSFYKNAVSLTFKGLRYEVETNLAMYISIDFSDNAFHGELPRELGYLNALKTLNFSHNSFSGNIPSSIGNLSNIESLDLSFNAFNGSIPPQLANLNYLEYLNLSFNRLSGKIPTGTQIQSFDKSSFQGNQGLFGPPLTLISRGEPKPRTSAPTSSQGSNWSSKRHIEWMLRGAEVGFPVGIIIFIGPILYIRRYREWYCKHLHRLVMRILRKEDSPRGRRGRRNRQQRYRR